MSTKIDYSAIKQKYLTKAKELRNYNAPIDGLETQLHASSNENTLFCIEDDNYSIYRFILDEYARLSYEMLREVISKLIAAYHFKSLAVVSNEPILSLVSLENSKRILYYFKKYGLPTKIDKMYIRSIGIQHGVVEVKFVSLVRKEAKTYSFDHFYDDYEMSLNEFFCHFFDNEEYLAFEKMEKQISETAKMYIGHTVVKTLSPYALYSFKRYVDSFIHGQEFASIIADSNAKRNIDKVSADKINEQFFKNSHYFALIGKTSFSQSLITAEWMYYSLLEAENVDLTIIALGFFKAFEQMLCEYIILHSGEDKKIRRLFLPQLNNKPEKIYLNDWSIRKKYINTMIDSLITFIEDYTELFDDALSDDAKEYIISAFYTIKAQRNGYIHRDNIVDKKIVNEAREATYIALYYLLGAFKYRDDDKVAFSIPLSDRPDYYRLREYMNYHAHKIYYIGHVDSLDYAAGALKDDGVFYDKYGDAHYTESYVYAILSVGLSKTVININDVANVQKERRVIDFSDDGLLVMEGEMHPVESGMEFSGPLRTLYKNGKFLANERMIVEGF